LQYNGGVANIKKWKISCCYLEKHVDGAGKVDGSVVVALLIDRWSDPEMVNSFQGGGLTFWYGKAATTGRPLETHYDKRSGDVAFIDR